MIRDNIGSIGRKPASSTTSPQSGEGFKNVLNKVLEKPRSLDDKKIKLAESVIIGGAGDTNEPYKIDILRAFKEAGFKNVRLSQKPISTGFWAKDAAIITLYNQPPGKHPFWSDDGKKSGAEPFKFNNFDSLSRQSKDPNEQYNLIGYSWGAVMAAHKAIAVTEKEKGTVDNLVLIGAPINKSMLSRLRGNPAIKNFI